VTAERAAGVDCGKGVHDGGDVADSSCDRLAAEAIGCCGVAAVVEAAAEDVAVRELDGGLGGWSIVMTM
jgi:hypothetical protein